MTRHDPKGGAVGEEPRPPTWLSEQCPSWCSREHQEDDHAEDRYHQSEPSIVPVIASTEPTVPLTASLEAIDLVIRVGRYVGDLVEWVAIEPLELLEPRLVLTVESTRQLLRHVTEQLDRHDAT